MMPSTVAEKHHIETRQDASNARPCYTVSTFRSRLIFPPPVQRSLLMGQGRSTPTLPPTELASKRAYSGACCYVDKESCKWGGIYMLHHVCPRLAQLPFSGVDAKASVSPSSRLLHFCRTEFCLSLSLSLSPRNPAFNGTRLVYPDPVNTSARYILQLLTHQTYIP